MMSSPEKICPLCSTPIPSFAPGGNCPGCLLKKPEASKDEPSLDSSLPDISRYRLHGLLGEGGFGLVYRATQLEPVHREVAIKVLKPGMDSAQVLARFEAERQALALMDHPHVARIFDAGETEDGRPFFAMELVEGVPLNEFCRDNLPGLEDRLRLFLDACAAVTHAHQKGLIHRDLKPSNILVGDSLKVIDFGIAKATENILTESTLLTGEAQMLGTPEYMSPEQADGGSLNLDTRTDVYSLGAVLYELIAGTPPFEGKELRSRGFAEILRIIREEEPPRPSTRITKTSGDKKLAQSVKSSPTEIRNDLDWIVMQALNKDRDRRYDTVSGLANDIRHFLNHEPVNARPPSLTYRFSKFVRKHRAATVAAALVILSIIATAVIGTTMAFRAEKARAAEARERERADEATYEARRTFSHSDLLIAGTHLEQNEPGNAVAHLARALRTDPKNRAASLKLLTTLASHSFPSPTRPSIYLNDRPAHLYLHRDGHQTLAISARGHALLHETKTGKTLGEINFPATAYTPAAANPTLTHFAIANTKGPVHLYELPSGLELAIFEIPNPILIREIMLSQDGLTVYTATHDGQVRAFTPGKKLPLWSFTHSDRAVCLDLSADGKLIAAGFGDGTVAVLETGTGKLLFTKRCHKNLVSDIRFLAGSSRFATSSYDHQARVWNSEDGSPQTPILQHRESIYHLAVSPCGGRIATSSYDRSTKVWDTFTGALHGKPLLHKDHVYFADFSPDGSRLATASRDRTVRLWDPYRGVAISAPIHHTEASSNALFTPDGHHLVTASRDGDINHWKITPSAARSLSFPHENPVTLALFDHEAPTLLTLSQNEKARLFNLNTGRQKGFAIPTPGKLVLYGPRLNPRFCDSFTTGRTRRLLTRNTIPLLANIDRTKASTFAIDPTMSRMLIGHTDGSVIFWDLESASLIHRTELAVAGLTCLDLEDDLALSGHHDGSVRLFNPRTGEILYRVKHQDKITSAIIDASRFQFATGSMDNTARIWSTHSGEPVSPPLVHTDKASTVGIICRFSPDGSLLATGGSHDATLRLWKTSDGSPHLRPLKHDDLLTTFAFSHDGLRIATGTPTHDGQADVNLWDLATGERLAPTIHHPETILWLQFSHNDQLLVSSSVDGTVLVTPQAPVFDSESLPDLAEHLANRRLDRNGSFQLPPFLPTTPVHPDNSWLNWLSTPAEQRAIAPGLHPDAKLPKPARSFSAYRKALLENPMDKSLMMQLSNSLLTSSWPRHQLEANFYRDLANRE